MIDTSPELARKYREMIMSKTPIERLKMVSGMFDTGKKLVKAGIIAKNGVLSEAEMRAAIFTRLYQRDFSPETFQRLKNHLRQAD